MIHALAYAAAGFAHPAPTKRPHPQPARIAALSTALALNVLLFGLVAIPMALPPPNAALVPDGITVRIIPRTLPPEIVPVQPDRAPPTPEPLQRTNAPPPSHTAAPTVATDIPTPTGTEYVLPAEQSAPLASPADNGPAFDPTPVALAYRSAPPPVYPRNAQRRGFAGTVQLRVLVDVDGRPLQVTIDRSSGFRELDDAARSQVLAHWLFQPAVRDGHAVQAIGLIPVTFSLRR